MVGFKTFLQFLNIWQIYVAKHRNRAFLKNMGRLEENEGKWGIWGDFWSIKGGKAVLAHTLYIIYRYKALNISAAEKIYRRCKRKLSLKWQLFIKGARKNVPNGKVFNAFELRRFPKGWILQKNIYIIYRMECLASLEAHIETHHRISWSTSSFIIVYILYNVSQIN